MVYPVLIHRSNFCTTVHQPFHGLNMPSLASNQQWRPLKKISLKSLSILELPYLVILKSNQSNFKKKKKSAVYLKNEFFSVTGVKVFWCKKWSLIIPLTISSIVLKYKSKNDRFESKNQLADIISVISLTSSSFVLPLLFYCFKGPCV